MTTNEITNLTSFLIQTGMYINEETKSNIMSFLMGFQMGADYDYNIFNGFAVYLENKYRIKQGYLSWCGQVEEYSTQNNLQWCVSIKRLLFDYFYSMSDFNSDLEFVEIHKSRIKLLIDNYQNGNKEDIKTEWKSLVILNNKNFINVWNDEEIQIMNLIETELQ